MTMDLSKVPVEMTTTERTGEQTDGTALPVLPHDPRPLDWGHVLDAAAARLEESWVRPDVTGHMLASGLANELAATLCAYGMVAEEVDHMREHSLPPHEPPPPK